MNVDYYAVSETGWRAVTGEGDLLMGEVLHSGLQPTIPETDNLIIKTALMSAATVAMAPLQDALELGVATQEEQDMLTRWKHYRILLNRIDISMATPAWPEQPSM